MDLQLQGKRALITGASKGIGLATARVLAEEGCDVVLAARSQDALAAAAEDIRQKYGRKAEAVAVDLSTRDGVETLARQVGALDILVNNAGAIPNGDLQKIDDDIWQDAWALKVHGYVRLTRALYGTLKDSRGVVINVIGAAGENPNGGYIAGSTGNAALMMFSRALAKTAKDDGVRVVAINPGPVATDRHITLMRSRAEQEFGDPERWQSLLGNMAFGRAAHPEEIGSAVAFLASARSAYTSGTILTINGAA